MVVKNLLVRGGADFSGIQKEMAKTQKTLSNFQSNVGGTMKKIGTLLGGLAIGKLVKDSTQMAMGVESAIGNINRNMGTNAKAFQNWVNTQAQGYGIAKADAYKYGGTFSNLLSSFTKNIKETASQTTELMKAAAIISSKTGRSYEDTAERIRSGMLGSTEAIEDLGVYTNISMIESTEAFKRFANGKTWAQLDFQTQQQIRLAAILEQTYARYGSELANTTQTSHAQFIASLKNIQLSIGQAFMPIYSFVLPALTALANGIAKVFNFIAQFTTALFGKAGSIKKQTGAVEQQAQGIGNLGGAMGGATNGANKLGKAQEKAGKKAKKAGKEAHGALMGFDEINQLDLDKGKGSDSEDSGSEGNGIGGVGTGSGMPPMDVGGFADSTVEVSEKIQAMANKIKGVFADLSGFFSKHKDVIISALGGILSAIASFEIISNWSKIVGAFKLALEGIGAAFAGISWPIVAVAAVIGLLVGNIIYLWRTNEEFRTSVLEVWQQIKDFVTTVVSDMWNIVKGIWDTYGATLVQNIKEFMASIQKIIINVWENILKPIITGALKMLSWLWNSHLKGLVQQVGEFVMKCVNGALELWNKFFAPIINSLVKQLGPTFSNIFRFITDVVGSKVAMIVDIVKGIIRALGGVIDFVVGVFTGNWKKAWNGVKEIFKGVFDSLVGIVKYPLNLIIDAINFVIRGLNKISFKTPDWVPGVGGKKFGVNITEIPKLAKGGITNGPTMALIGDNPGGQEVVSPLDKLQDMLVSAVGTAMLETSQFNSNNKNPSGGDVYLQIDGTTFARLINPYSTKENQRVGTNNLIIKTT